MKLAIYDMGALTADIYNSLQNGDKVRFRRNGDSLFEDGRIVILKEGIWNKKPYVLFDNTEIYKDVSDDVMVKCGWAMSLCSVPLYAEFEILKS